ncbi:MAG: bifunctional histidinol-phosphatase/imidazoleglycerol-phosphate dehydratase HisB [Patescibacteria group bacterium]
MGMMGIRSFASIINEPQDTYQVDSLEKLVILPNAVEGLKRIQEDGYKLVMVTNQDGLGTSSFPRKAFETAQEALLASLKEQGVAFYQIFVCPHTPEDGCACRKPKIGLLDEFLASELMDTEKSFVVGDRESDSELAKNLGIRAYRMETNGRFPRVASVERVTKETAIFVQVNLDGRGKFSVDTGLGFFNHMLEQFSKHSLIDLVVSAKGDLVVDEHHTVEDTGLAIAKAVSNALGERRGISRYGFLLPMDDTLAEVAIDLGGRPYAVWNAEFKRDKVGDLPTELVEHFFRSLADELRANIHVNVRYGRNEHHKIEAIFKAFAKSMRAAVSIDERLRGGLPTTKGKL